MNNENKFEYSQAMIQKIIEATEQRLDASQKSLDEKAAGMAEGEMYKNMTEVCCKETEAYLGQANNMLKVLTDPSALEIAYNALCETESFQAICTDELKGFPRVMLMMILAGAEAGAVHDAMGMVEDEEEKARLDKLADIYHGYMKDAARYGKGEDKKIIYA